MLNKMNDIATLIPGYTFREALEQNTLGNTFVLQAKHIKQGETISRTDDLSKITFNSFRSNAFLEKGDIIIISRAMGAGNFKSSVYTANDTNVLASSSTLIIRLKNNLMLPEYLSFYLNSKHGQLALTQIASGSHLQTLLRSNLENLELPTPSIDKQIAIVALHKNIQMQEKILAKKAELRKNLLNSSFNNSLLN